jgi:hypothetical protein
VDAYFCGPLIRKGHYTLFAILYRQEIRVLLREKWKKMPLVLESIRQVEA